MHILIQINFGIILWIFFGHGHDTHFIMLGPCSLPIQTLHARPIALGP
jgi:hypothetical protein